MANSDKKKSKSSKGTIWLIVIAFLVFVLIGLSAFSIFTVRQAAAAVPISLRSHEIADYSIDLGGMLVPAVRIDLIEAAILDREGEGANVESRITEVAVNLKTPVPTITPRPTDSAAQETEAPVSTSTIEVSPTPGEELTATATETATATLTSSPTEETVTATITMTPSLTDTLAPGVTPSITFTPSTTPTATQTSTGLPGPSATPTATSTPGERMYNNIVVPVGPVTDISETNFEAEVWDTQACSGPCQNGDGSPEVFFEFRDPGGALIHSQSQTVVRYCTFTGNVTCNLMGAGMWDSLTNGIYTLRVRSRPSGSDPWSSWESVPVTIAKPNTPTPTATNTPTPTSTPTPTATDIPVDCSLLRIQGFNHSGQIAGWTIYNDSSSAVRIDQLSLIWPNNNDDLIKVELSSNAIWDDGQSPPSVNINIGDWKVGVSRTIPPFSSRALDFQFNLPVEAFGYTLSITFNNSCVKSATDMD